MNTGKGARFILSRKRCQVYFRKRGKGARFILRKRCQVYFRESGTAGK
jgi:hypothetical protein